MAERRKKFVPVNPAAASAMLESHPKHIPDPYDTRKEQETTKRLDALVHAPKIFKKGGKGVPSTFSPHPKYMSEAEAEYLQLINERKKPKKRKRKKKKSKDALVVVKGMLDSPRGYGGEVEARKEQENTE